MSTIKKDKCQLTQIVSKFLGVISLKYCTYFAVTKAAQA